MVVYENVRAVPFSWLVEIFGLRIRAQFGEEEVSGVAFGQAYPSTGLRNHISLTNTGFRHRHTTHRLDDVEKRVSVCFATGLLHAQAAESNTHVAYLQRELAATARRRKAVIIACGLIEVETDCFESYCKDFRLSRHITIRKCEFGWNLIAFVVNTRAGKIFLSFLVLPELPFTGVSQFSSGYG
jgi:hypothetical protein